jgi:hypothetical protein
VCAVGPIKEERKEGEGKTKAGGLESDLVEVVLFEDGTKPSRVDACWITPLVKLVIWFGGYRDVNCLLPREEWSCTQYMFDHGSVSSQHCLSCE